MSSLSTWVCLGCKCTHLLKIIIAVLALSNKREEKGCRKLEGINTGYYFFLVWKMKDSNRMVKVFKKGERNWEYVKE